MSEEKRVVDGEGRDLHIGDRVMIIRPDGLSEDIAKMNEECGNDWVYCGIKKCHTHWYGVIVAKSGDYNREAMMLMDKNRRVGAIVRSWMIEARERRNIIDDFVREVNQFHDWKDMELR